MVRSTSGALARGVLAVFSLGLATLLPVGASPAAGQSVLDRPPNLHGTWGGRTGMLYFNFIHRFTATDAPLRKVINYPTFLLAAGLPGDLLVGARYGTNSELVQGIPNEWELFGRFTPSVGRDWPVEVALNGAYNQAARSADGELLLAHGFGRLRVIGGARGFSNAFDDGRARWALAGGATLRLTEHVALAGDYARLVDLKESEGKAAWSAGLQLAIPYTPHTFSLQVSNATTTTLEGSSLGSKNRRYGFEFTVPITLARYFGGRSGDATAQEPVAAPDSAGAPVAAADTSSGAPPAADSAAYAPTPDTAAAARVDTAAATPVAPDTAAGRAARETGADSSRAAGAQSTPRPRPSRVVEVRMTNRLQFTPGVLRIRVGDRVQWRNDSGLIHTVTADPSKAAQRSHVKLPAGASTFNSGDIKPGTTYQHTFTVAGEYHYVCIPHELAGMTGTVIVEK